jgi:hypothetical protein
MNEVGVNAKRGRMEKIERFLYLCDCNRKSELIFFESKDANREC